MDILTHILSGIAAATAIAAYSSRPLKDKFLIICTGAVGAMLPDMDAVTRWSGFDAAIGKALGLSQTGRSIYYGHHWYSHHNFMHSLAAAAVFTLAMTLLGYLYCRRRSAFRTVSVFIMDKRGFIFSFLTGYLMHLLGDLPTPDGTWNGIKLFWPLNMPVGGFDYIWWWNNYDIFLIFLTGGIINAILIFSNRLLKMRPLRYFPALVFLCTICATTLQITNRPLSFSAAGGLSGHADRERLSLAIQEDILGRRLYGAVHALDRKIPIPF